MRFSRRQRPDPTINLTSLNDILFIVLVFLVLTTTFREATQLEVDLPQAATGERVTDDPPGYRPSEGVSRRRSLRLAAAGDAG